jgi:hypothetical protein
MMIFFSKRRRDDSLIVGRIGAREVKTGHFCSVVCPVSVQNATLKPYPLAETFDALPSFFPASQ